MSSSRGHRSSRSSSKSSGWSGWEWDGDHGRYKRSRYTSRGNITALSVDFGLTSITGELIWDWEKPPDEDAEAATQPPADLDPIQEDVDPTSEITDSLQNTTLDTVQGAGYGTQYNTQYSTQYGTPKYGTQYGAQVGKGKATATASTVTFSTCTSNDYRGLFMLTIMQRLQTMLELTGGVEHRRLERIAAWIRVSLHDPSLLLPDVNFYRL